MNSLSMHNDNLNALKLSLCGIGIYTIIRVDSAFSLVASCVLLKYTRTDDVK